MICDKHCPMLNLDTGECKSDKECELRDRASICGDCIHDKVCGEEGHLDPAMTFCVDKVSTDVIGMISRTHGLRLSDIMSVLPCDWFTVLSPSGEMNNSVVYTYPERFRVLKINYDVEQQSLCVVVEEVHV